VVVVVVVVVMVVVVETFSYIIRTRCYISAPELCCSTYWRGTWFMSVLVTLQTDT